MAERMKIRKQSAWNWSKICRLCLMFSQRTCSSFWLWTLRGHLFSKKAMNVLIFPSILHPDDTQNTVSDFVKCYTCLQGSLHAAHWKWENFINVIWLHHVSVISGILSSCGSLRSIYLNQVQVIFSEHHMLARLRSLIPFSNFPDEINRRNLGKRLQTIGF